MKVNSEEERFHKNLLNVLKAIDEHLDVMATYLDEIRKAIKRWKP